MTPKQENPEWLAIKKLPELSERRLVISIPKRIVRLSTRRSRLKRLIREAVRSRQKEKPGKTGPLHFIVRRPVRQDVKLCDVLELTKKLLRHYD